jgi:hypothetical protein
MSQLQVQDEHRESEDGGMQLVDNDEYLMELPSEPMPDDENEVQSAQLGSSSRCGGNGDN